MQAPWIVDKGMYTATADFSGHCLEQALARFNAKKRFSKLAAVGFNRRYRTDKTSTEANDGPIK
ncbi:MAG: hypothetical protein GZ085_11080 [Sulfuriferula multivorans]|uniref:Uncharacterized protein n=1 Tax=Sulfuriferula multivorans TaxID=1559896 RepID=A0A7C9TB86_9PROT|nr:hypothetical protein [Sulfuriferula multivorans]